MPKVSVIVPNYNHAMFLRRRLESVYAQLYHDFEVLILDDCSTDDSLVIIERFIDRPNTVFIPSPNNGGSAFRQWRRGIERACGDYIWIAESDDSASVHLLGSLTSLLDADPHMGLAYSQSWMMDLEGRITGDALGWTADLNLDRWKRNFVNDGRDEIRRFLIRKNTIPNASAVLIRRRALEDAGGVIASPMRLCGDWLQWVRILRNSRIGFCANRLNYWRQDSSNARAVLNGVLEWQEGRVVVEEACEALGIGELERLRMVLAFQERCLGWQADSVKRLLATKSLASQDIG